MRYSEYRHENKRKVSSLFVVSFLCVFFCAAALGTLRLYGLYLEHRISDTTARIESCREQNLDMEHRFSELLSPARIYSYARENLGMVNAVNVATIRVDGEAVVMAKASAEGTQTANASGFLDYLNPFVKTAHAKN